MMKCKTCGCKSESEYCFHHKPRKALPRSSVPWKGKDEVREPKESMWRMFIEIAEERKDKDGYLYCFETGERIPKSLYDSTTIFHHLLEKERSKFPQYKMRKWNIYIVKPEIHDLTHMDIDKTPRLKEERDRLIEKHINNELH